MNGDRDPERIKLMNNVPPSPASIASEDSKRVRKLESAVAWDSARMYNFTIDLTNCNSCKYGRIFADASGPTMKKVAKTLLKTPRASALSPPPMLQGPASWTFLTTHSYVLLSLYRQSDQRLRDVATAVGITERMVQKIVVELVDAGYLHIIKEGRCNRYSVNLKLQLRHPLGMQHTIGELLALLS